MESVRHTAFVPLIACAALCAIYAVLAAVAVSGKSATYDEPLHVMLGWLEMHRGDFRFMPENPPLWEYWVALPLGTDAINANGARADAGLEERAVHALYRTPPARGIELVADSRYMCLALAILLGLLVAKWAGELAGPVGAVGAMFVFAFDPNWLGHGPLVKNDVAFALTYVAAAYAVWRVGWRATWWSILAAVAMPAVCLGTKLTGLIVGLVMVVSLLVRAVLPRPWMSVCRRRGKIGVAISLWLAAAAIAYAGLWAQYRFRFDAGMDMQALTNDLRRPDYFTGAALWIERHRLAPQAWAGGLIYFQSHDATGKAAYLAGSVYRGGRWIYFPLAWLFKEPLAIIAGAIAAAIMALRARGKAGWPGLALLIPAAIALLLDMAGNMNIGIRHLLPVMAFIDIGIGWCAARLWRGGRFARGALVMLAAGLAAETLFAAPNYIAFFNLACGGSRGGLKLLGDSNLDWGQDLPLLANWQQAHPNIPLYLDYFGSCDPAAYGIKYVNVVGGYKWGPPPQLPYWPGVAAISATNLQGIYEMNASEDFAALYRGRAPVQILGGTIYLFNFPP